LIVAALETHLARGFPRPRAWTTLPKMGHHVGG